LSLEALVEIYATREAIEGMLASEAARQRPGTPPREIEELLAMQKTEVLRGEDFVELDRRFHRAIYATTGFQIAIDVLERLLDQSERYARMYAQQPSERRRSFAEHRQILEAVRAGEADRARELTSRHIDRGRGMLTQFVSERLNREQGEGAADGTS
jgi:GntR family transcriptional repressor for pyruvate dehydrogenase complex